MKKFIYLACAACAFLQLVSDTQVIALKRENSDTDQINRNVRPRTDIPDEPAEQIVSASSIEGSFVNKLKEKCSLAYTYSELVARDDTGMKALELEGEFALFFRRDSKEEANFAGMVSKIGNRVIVAFPGTRTDRPDSVLEVDKRTNWQFQGNDGGFLESIGERGVVHAGFAKEVMEFWPNLSACMTRFSGYNEVFFTGHSRGGGVALLTAFKYAHEHHDEIARHPNSVKVFTFSAPPVFSKESVSSFYRNIEARNVVCISRSFDPISTLPCIAFSHVGIQATISLKLANPHSLDNFSDDEIRDIMNQVKENDDKGLYGDLAAEQKNRCIVM